jgi:hypothetical protein
MSNFIKYIGMVLFCVSVIQAYDSSGITGNRAWQEQEARELHERAATQAALNQQQQAWARAMAQAQAREALNNRVRQNPAMALHDANQALEHEEYGQATELYEAIAGISLLEHPEFETINLQALVGLGNAYYFTDRWHDAHQAFATAEGFARENREFQMVQAEALYYLGCLMRRGDRQIGGQEPNLDEALRYHENASHHAESSNNLEVFFKSLCAIARNIS